MSVVNNKNSINSYPNEFVCGCLELPPTEVIVWMEVWVSRSRKVPKCIIVLMEANWRRI